MKRLIPLLLLVTACWEDERPVMWERDRTVLAVRLGDIEQGVLGATHHAGVVDEEYGGSAHAHACS